MILILDRSADFAYSNIFFMMNPPTDPKKKRIGRHGRSDYFLFLGRPTDPIVFYFWADRPIRLFFVFEPTGRSEKKIGSAVPADPIIFLASADRPIRFFCFGRPADPKFLSDRIDRPNQSDHFGHP